MRILERQVATSGPDASQESKDETNVNQASQK